MKSGNLWVLVAVVTVGLAVRRVWWTPGAPVPRQVGETAVTLADAKAAGRDVPDGEMADGNADRGTAVDQTPDKQTADGNRGHVAGAETPEDLAERNRRWLPGVWEDEYQGKRTMTLRPDGTGTMRVELSGAQATLVARELVFEMEWSADGNRITKTTVGGTPAKKVNLILKMMGNSTVETILELTAERLRLLDRDGVTQYDWKRAGTAREG